MGVWWIPQISRQNQSKKYQKFEISRIGFRPKCIGVLLNLIASEYLDLPKATFDRYLVDLCLYGFGWSASVSSVHLRITQKISFLCLHLWPPVIDVAKSTCLPSVSWPLVTCFACADSCTKGDGRCIQSRINGLMQKTEGQGPPAEVFIWSHPHWGNISRL